MKSPLWIKSVRKYTLNLSNGCKWYLHWIILKKTKFKILKIVFLQFHEGKWSRHCFVTILGSIIFYLIKFRNNFRCRVEYTGFLRGFYLIMNRACFKPSVIGLKELLERGCKTRFRFGKSPYTNNSSKSSKQSSPEKTKKLSKKS